MPEHAGGVTPRSSSGSALRPSPNVARVNAVRLRVYDHVLPRGQRPTAAHRQHWRHCPHDSHAERAKAELLYDLNEPVFPEVCEFAGVTLSRYVLEWPGPPPTSRSSTSCVGDDCGRRACKTISSLVRRSPMSGLTGLQEGGGAINVQGEEQKKLDVITNTVLKNALKFTGKMGVLASEEEDEPVGMEATARHVQVGEGSHPGGERQVRRGLRPARRLVQRRRQHPDRHNLRHL